MPIEIIVPRLGWSMEEGTFSAWLKQDGEAVTAGDPLFVLESDKATQEVESMDAGLLRLPPDAPRPGSMVKVGQRLAYLLAPGEPAPWEAAGALPPPPSSASRPSPNPIRAEQPPAAASPSTSPDETREESDGRPLTTPPAISPRAARVARELGVDWTRVTGSGRTGRIRERDIRAAAAQAGRGPDTIGTRNPVLAPGTTPG